jgi:ABC-type transport system involved in cytochrome c biogenesis permease subunit
LLIYPLSVFCRRFLNVSSDAADALIGFVLLFPAGFIFSSEPQLLPPALQSPLFIPHVFVYLLGYVIMFKAGVQAVYQLTKKNEQYEYATYKMVYFGFPLITSGLILGSWWGKLAWGDYWNWDPKELWSLATWLIFVEYLHFRFIFGKKHANVNSVLVILGVLAVFVTLLWLNLSRLFPSLHNYAGGT